MQITFQFIHTCTNLKSTTLLQDSSITVYDPNFALWPGLSALPSPARTNFLFWALKVWKRDSWCLSYVKWIAGCRIFLWWRKKVLKAHFNIWNIHSTFAGNAPAYKIAADRYMLPAGMFPIYGWLSQNHVCLHFPQNCTIHKNEPVVAVVKRTPQE